MFNLDYAFLEQTIPGDTFLTGIYINASVTSKKAVMLLKAFIERLLHYEDLLRLHGFLYLC